MICFIGQYIERLVTLLRDHAEPLFSLISASINIIISSFESIFIGTPVWLVFLMVLGVAVLRMDRGFAALMSIGIAGIVAMNLWHATMTTLALVTTSTLVSLLLGFPVGIMAGKFNWVDRIVRPILDFMQTMPAFVYLIPAVMFFGLGKVPGVIATVIFAMPPLVRLVNIGIRQVPNELIEAGQAFGCNAWQLLFKVQVPTAKPSIMAGINQNIMLSLSMVVIASMIGAGGLGNEVLKGIQRLDIGTGFEGGIAVVIMAVILDRITQSFSMPPKGILGANTMQLFQSIFTRLRRLVS